MHLYNSTRLIHIASAVGKPLYMDRGTLSQTHLDFARACIEAGIYDKIPSTLNIDTRGGHVVEVQVIVP